MTEINPREVYTTSEVQSLLKISNSTVKRLVKKGFIRANKIGGQYRVLGKELIRLLSPTIERRAVLAYQEVKHKVKTKLKSW